jgi:subtilisin family serine protease
MATPPVHVDGEVLAALADGGTTSFFVYLDERADLSGAAEIADKAAKGRFVYEQLTATAEGSQSGLVAMLAARGAEFTPFWISNTVLVHGDRKLLDRITARPEVARIEAHRVFEIPQPSVGTDDAEINVVEWGIANINADDVWADFGVTGQGIVVANIDTGVRHTHSALVNQYRGNLGGGSFDHNYNWWDPAGVCPPGVPCDNNNHGTHTMGTMVGDDGGSNQIGVAPGARWIAAKGCESNSCSSGALLSSGQWVAAPTDLNGNNPDPSKAPHIVNNSWGGGGGDTWYADTVNAWVAAGIFPMFSAGNSGPACGTAGSPGDYPQSYAVGAYDISNNIASFSSRGPSAVDGGTKPNVSAPGVSVRSATAGSNTSYGTFSGTSMASPHASGVVALVWSANSGFVGDINGTRSVLDDTARDTSNLQCGGTADDNNVFGEGRIDAHAAVSQVADPGNQPPVAAFTPTCDDATLTCTFDGSASLDPDGAVVAWNWNFGDGSTGSGQVVSHTYAGAGTFTVTLTVTDDAGATDADTQPVTVGAPPGVVFSDDFETDRGWVTNPQGSDTATTGMWERADPEGTSFGIALQLGETTSGTHDLVTGALAGSGPGSFDVDGGDTTVRSPSIALPSGVSLELSFNYYFAHLDNATSADYLRVSVVAGGTSTVFEQLGAAVDRAGVWTPATVDLSDFAGQGIQLQVEAADAAGASLIEAGVDDVVITRS